MILVEHLLLSLMLEIILKQRIKQDRWGKSHLSNYNDKWTYHKTI